MDLSATIEHFRAANWLYGKCSLKLSAALGTHVGSVRQSSCTNVMHIGGPHVHERVSRPARRAVSTGRSPSIQVFGVGRTGGAGVQLPCRSESNHLPQISFAQSGVVSTAAPPPASGAALGKATALRPASEPVHSSVPRNAAEIDALLAKLPNLSFMHARSLLFSMT